MHGILSKLYIAIMRHIIMFGLTLLKRDYVYYLQNMILILDIQNLVNIEILIGLIQKQKGVTMINKFLWWIDNASIDQIYIIGFIPLVILLILLLLFIILNNIL